MPYNWNRGRFAMLVGYGGKILINQFHRDSVGTCFLDWCANKETRNLLEAAFTQCYSLGVKQSGLPAQIRLDLPAGDIIEVQVSFKPWINQGEVLVEALRDFTGILSNRETELLGLIADDISDNTAAEAMGIKPGTIRSMRKRMKEKLGVTRDEALLMVAQSLGWNHGAREAAP